MSETVPDPAPAPVPARVAQPESAPGAVSGATDSRAVFRLPRSAYLAVLFLVFGVTVLVRGYAWLPVYLVPLGAAYFIARRATVLDGRGIEVRALLAARRVPWRDVAGLAVDDRGAVSASLVSGAVLRLPYVRVSHLPVLHALTGGRVPAIEDVPKPVSSSPRRR